MKQKADNEALEVETDLEVELDTPEMDEQDQTEDLDVEDEQESEEQEEDGEESQEDDSESEDDEGELENEFYLGDEELGSPASEDEQEEDEQATPLIKQLRNKLKEQGKRIKELESGRSDDPGADNKAEVTELPPRPTLESVDYDEDKLTEELEKWYTTKADIDRRKKEQSEQLEQLQKVHQEKLSRYQERKAQVKVQGFDIAEKAVISEVPENIQGAIIHYSESPEMVVLALGRNKELRTKAAQTTDPIELGRLIGTIEAKARIAPKANKKKSVTPQVKARGGADIAGVEKALDRARKSGDYTEVMRLKEKLNKK